MRQQNAKRMSVLVLSILLLTAAAFTATQLLKNDETTDEVLYSAPPNMEDIVERVGVMEDIPYAEMDNSLLDLYRLKTVKEEVPVILWIHGGGYVGGSKDSRQAYAMALADAGYLVANIDYSLAPGQLYPGPILQANAALEFLMTEAPKFGGDMERVYIGGDSAGAQISSQLAAAISNPNLARTMDFQPALRAEQLSGTILHCGLYNMDTVRETGFPSIDLFLSAYTGQEIFESYPRIDELSTVKHVTPNFPPTFLTVGDADPFASQSQELAAALQTNGVPVETVFFNGTGKNLKHEFQYALHTEEAQYALKEAIEFLAHTSIE